MSTSAGQTEMICPNGHGVKPGKFCNDCGAQLISNPVQPETDPPYEAFGDAPCKCQYPLNHGHQAFCPGCGHALKWTCR